MTRLLIIGDARISSTCLMAGVSEESNNYMCLTEKKKLFKIHYGKVDLNIKEKNRYE